MRKTRAAIANELKQNPPLNSLEQQLLQEEHRQKLRHCVKSSKEDYFKLLKEESKGNRIPLIFTFQEAPLESRRTTNTRRLYRYILFRGKDLKMECITPKLYKKRLEFLNASAENQRHITISLQANDNRQDRLGLKKVLHREFKNADFLKLHLSTRNISKNALRTAIDSLPQSFSNIRMADIDISFVMLKDAHELKILFKKALPQLTRLSELILTCTGDTVFAGKGITHLSDALEQRFYNLKRSTYTTKSCSKVKDINIQSLFKALEKGLPKLTHLSLDVHNFAAEESLSTLSRSLEAKITQLIHLKLHFPWIEQADIESTLLVQAISKGIRNLKTLDLLSRSPNLSSKYVEELANMLRSKPNNLEVLKLTITNSEKIDGKDIKALTNALKSGLPTVKTILIDLSACKKIDVVDVASLCEGLCEGVLNAKNIEIRRHRLSIPLQPSDEEEITKIRNMLRARFPKSITLVSMF